MNDATHAPEVLVVDDEPQVLTAIGDMLEDECIVHTASSADRAISIVRENKAISVIISDQRMPKTDGATFLSEVQRLSSATRILLTGYADLEAVIRAVNEGKIFAYLSKPWDSENLKVVVHQAINYYAINQELAAERRLLNNLMDSVPAAVFFKDRDHRHILANAVAAEYFGFKDPKEVIGKTLHDFLPPDVADERTREEKEIFRSGQPLVDKVFRNVRPLSATRWYSSTKAPVLDEKGRPYRLVCVTQDVTERVRRETETSLLLEIGQAILHAADTDSAYTEILRLIGEKTNLAYGQAWVWDAPRERLVPGPVWHVGGEAMTGFQEFTARLSFEPGRGLVGRVAETREAEWLAEISRTSTDRFVSRDEAIAAGLHASLTVPVLSARDTVVAVLQFFLREATEQDRRQVDLILDIARQLGVFIARKQAEDDRRESEDRFRILLESAGEGIYAVDCEGRVTFCNSACLESLGYKSPTPLVGEVMHHLIQHSHADGAPYPFDDCRIGGAYRHGEHVHADDEVFWRADGTSFPVEYVARPVRRDGEIVGAIVAFSDISARLRTARELQEQQSLLSNILSSIPQFVFWKDRDSRFLGCNTNFARLLGFAEPHEIVGLTDFELPVTREEAERFRSADLQVIQDAAPRLNVEETIHDPDGDAHNLLSSKVPLFDHRGAVVGMLGVLADITEHRQLETQLRQSQKMDAIGQLTGGVAHDFNNLLTVIMGNLQLLERSLKGSERQEKQVRMAHDAARRGADLTRRLLAFSRKQVLDPKIASVNEVVAGMEPLFRRIIGEHIEIRTGLSSNAAPVHIDVAQFENAILNLVVNARDAMPDGGRITIETETVTLDEHYAASHVDVTSGRHTVVIVSDTGIGIPKDKIDHVFEPFFTTKEIGKGTGLGLSMVYGFLKQSGGHAAIYSEEGVGTSVRLYFPTVAKEAEVIAGAADEEGDEMPGGSERILIVEDDAEVRFTVASLLENLGYEVVEADTGVEGLEVVRRRDDIDLILTDVIMPGGMTGPELAVAALELRPAIKVLVTSGYPRDTVTSNGVLKPGVAFIGKPYEHEELARKLRDILDGGPV